VLAELPWLRAAASFSQLHLRVYAQLPTPSDFPLPLLARPLAVRAFNERTQPQVRQHDHLEAARHEQPLGDG